MLRGVVEDPDLEIFKGRLDGALINLAELKMSLHIARRWELDDF